MYTQEHKSRINKELINIGLSRYALLKNEIKYLPHIIHEDEIISAAITGRTEVGSVMLVATDKRVLYLDCKSFYTTTDEITYDVVAGVLYHVQGLFANVVLHTRVGEYNLRFVNKKLARHFVHFLEDKRLETPDSRTTTTDIKKGRLLNREKFKALSTLDKTARSFLCTHYLGVLSTISRTGYVHGATVYYTIVDDQIYFLTKSETNKAKNLIVNPRIALTIFEEYSLQSMQLRGVAEVENNQSIKKQVFEHITESRSYDNGPSSPPVTKIIDGYYVIFRLKITEAKYNKYK